MKKDNRLEKKLARKFLNHVGRQNLVAVEELGTVRGAIMGNPGTRGFFEGPQFSTDEKKKMMGEIARRLSLSEGTRKFFEYLIGIDAVNRLDGIVESAVKLYLDYARRAKAVVTSAVDFPAEGPLADRLKTALKKLTGRDVDIEYVRDPSVLGGVLVQVESTMFDSSLKGQLRLLKEELIKG
ncbi:MAG: ATP synthase F1 subunit delta [Nitrospiraceae bacterium]|nr:ATP synthase F1 subunit delta [Nitrospiraceae bacterium]